MSPRRLSAFIGFDAEIIEALEPKSQRRLQNLSRWYLLPCVSMGLSAGLFWWLVERSVLGVVCLVPAVALMMLNLLRLIVSGGGAAPHWPEARVSRWAPTLPPLLVLGGLAACFAQPVQLAFFAPLVETKVTEHREALAAKHSEIEGLTSTAVYQRRLDRCYFATYRLALLWHRPEGPLLFTFLFCGVSLTPLLMGHTTHLSALRAYERARWQQVRNHVLEREREHQRDVNAALGAYRLFAPGPLPKVAQAPPARTTEAAP